MDLSQRQTREVVIRGETFVIQEMTGGDQAKLFEKRDENNAEIAMWYVLFMCKSPKFESINQVRDIAASWINPLAEACTKWNRELGETEKNGSGRIATGGGSPTDSPKSPAGLM